MTVSSSIKRNWIPENTWQIPERSHAWSAQNMLDRCPEGLYSRGHGHTTCRVRLWSDRRRGCVMGWIHRCAKACPERLFSRGSFRASGYRRTHDPGHHLVGSRWITTRIDEARLSNPCSPRPGGARQPSLDPYWAQVCQRGGSRSDHRGAAGGDSRIVSGPEPGCPIAACVGRPWSVVLWSRGGFSGRVKSWGGKGSFW